jgi:hypothetical protein
METNINFQTLKERIGASNSNASRNRNKYPIQEQATLKEIWEYGPCECDSSCTCKKFDCKSHWRLKHSLTFNDILSAFIRMFVDKRLHKKILDWINGTLPFPDKISNRASGSLLVLKDIRDDWEDSYPNALNHFKTLICDDWYNNYLKARWDFPIQKSVYKVKQYCLLTPDICSPYDTISRNQIIHCLKINDLTYFKMLNHLREKLITILRSENQTLSNFRRLDSPEKDLPFDANSISRRRANFDYGNTYSPEERPLSRIIDKYFYQPSVRKTGK